LSPPAASPASSAWSRRSAIGWPLVAAKRSAVFWITCWPASMLPATEKSGPATCPAQSMHCLPVCCAMRPAIVDDMELAHMGARIGAGHARDDLAGDTLSRNSRMPSIA